MSKTNIPDKVIIQLWTLAGGRCEYRGCNKPLWRDDLTMSKMNKAYIAHIVADSADGPRGDTIRSEKLSKDFNNLMLLCDEHHRMIDRENVDGHPEPLLIQMKQEHEKRIELVTSLIHSQKTHLVFYGSNIGIQSSPINYEECVQAILPEKFPTDRYGIEIGLKNSNIYDDEDLYWEIESKNLERQFIEKVEPIISQHPIKSFSLFGLAPQPLLIKLGTLASDLHDVIVYQRQREPSSWKWISNVKFDGFTVIEPKEFDGIPVLNLSLSATITNDRIERTLHSKVSIWTITHNNPHNDFLKSKEILFEFRNVCRRIFDKVKAIHGQDSELHVFPAMPVSAAIELGRVWMPKADMTLIIYDQSKINKGFYRTIRI